MPPPPPAPGLPRWADPAAAALIAAGAAAYWNSLETPFVFDDPLAILANPTIRHLWPPGPALSPPHGHGATVEGRPLLNFSLAINYAISGTRVWSYHALNLIIHILAGLALFGVVRRTLERIDPAFKVGTGGPARPGKLARRTERADLSRRSLAETDGRLVTAQRSEDGDARPYLVAAAVALLWTVHPLQTESVTYVVQRAESLMGLFYLLTLYCFIRGVMPSFAKATAGEKSARRAPFLWFGLSWLACLFGMATKEVMVSAPVIVFLYDRTFVSGSFREAWKRHRAVHLSLAATWLLLAGLVAGAGSRGGTSGFGSGVAPLAYWATQFPAVVRYLGLALWPHPLIFDHGTEWVRSAGTVVIPALLVAGFLAGTAFALRRRPWLGFLGAWFFCILAPTSLMPGNRQTMAEHRMYLPLAAVMVLVVVGVERVVSGRGRTSAVALAKAGDRPVSASAIIFMMLCGGLAGFGGFLTAGRNLAYRSALALYADTVAKLPDNAFARYNLGKALDEAGRPREAVPQYEAAIRLRPDLADPYNNLGASLAELGQGDAAIACYQAALRLQPNLADAHYNLGNALVQSGRKSEAAGQYRAALLAKPDYLDAGDNLGSTLLDLGRAGEAADQYQAVLRIDPNRPETRYNLGNAYRVLGRTAEATEQYAWALRLDPGFAPARAALQAAKR